MVGIQFFGINFIVGGADGDRTVGLLNAIQALSQLSYSPTVNNFKKNLTQRKKECQFNSGVIENLTLP